MKTVLTMAFAAALTAVPMSANAYPVVDQGDFPVLTVLQNMSSGVYVGQSFTVGVSGQMTGAALPIARDNNFDNDLIVYLIKVENSSLVGLPLAKVTIPYGSLPPYVNAPWPSSYMSHLLTVDFKPYHIPVTAGETLAIVVTSTTPPLAARLGPTLWGGGCDGNSVGPTTVCGSDPGTNPGYSRGSAFLSYSLTGSYSVEPNYTLGFETFVDQSPFTGNPGSSNCIEQSAADLTIQYGGLSQAAASLGYSSAQTLESAIVTFCGS